MTNTTPETEIENTNDVHPTSGTDTRKRRFEISYSDRTITLVDREVDKKYPFTVPQLTPQLEFYTLTQGLIKIITANFAGDKGVTGDDFLQAFQVYVETPEDTIAKKFIENKAAPKEKGWVCILSELELLAFAMHLRRHNKVITRDEDVTAETALHLLRSERVSKDVQEKIRRNRDFIQIYLSLLPDEDTDSLF